MAERGLSTMNVSLPTPLKQYVDSRVATGIYGSASEFVREAIREKFLREQERAQAEAVLRAQLLEGLESGPSRDLDSSFTSRMKARLRQNDLHQGG